MKYLVRSVKYFFYLLIILTIILFALTKLGMVEADIEMMFRNGYDSLWQIALMLLVFAALYPKWGYSRKEIKALGSPEEVVPAVKSYMDDRGYKLASEADGVMKFVLRSPIVRAVKMCEDTITIEKTLAGFEIEGLSRDIFRIASGIEARLSLPPER